MEKKKNVLSPPKKIKETLPKKKVYVKPELKRHGNLRQMVLQGREIQPFLSLDACTNMIPYETNDQLMHDRQK